jgi:hypothetical protein
MASRKPNFIKDIRDYGNVKAMYQSWSDDADDYVFTDIPTRECTFGDFGIETNRTDHRFFNPRNEDISLLKRVMPALHCIDEPLIINGNWNTAKFKVLLLLFEKCDA